VNATAEAMALCQSHASLAAAGELSLENAKSMHARCVALAEQLHAQMTAQSYELAQSQRAHNAYARANGSGVL